MDDASEVTLSGSAFQVLVTQSCKQRVKAMCFIQLKNLSDHTWKYQYVMKKLQ